MSLRTRVQRLERSVSQTCQVEPQREDLFARMKRHAEYLRGEAPRPPERPCPPGIDPAQWACRMRIGRCLDYRQTGELGPDEYLPEMDEAERRYLDDLVGVLDKGASRRATPETADTRA